MVGSNTTDKEDNPMSNLLLRGGLVHDAVHETPYIADIAVVDGKIAAIGENLAAPEGAQIIDCADKNVYPGFVEAHGHIGLDGYGIGYEGQDYNEYGDPVTPHLRAIDGIKPGDYAFLEAAAAGVTSVCTRAPRTFWAAHSPRSRPAANAWTTWSSRLRSR